MSIKRTFGLIGFPLGHSFSKRYYDTKIENEGIRDVDYQLFPLPNIEGLEDLLIERPDLQGINVTIPHKISVIPYLDSISEEAREIGAVNCIRIIRDGSTSSARGYILKGYNTDVFGFASSLKPLLHISDTDRPHQHSKALVLGDGGAAKAVYAGLRSLGISYVSVSRNPNPGLEFKQIGYGDLDYEVLQEHTLIINTTPLGTFPDTMTFPDIPYDALGSEHVLFDLVYNPTITSFLQKGQERGATIKNGYEMLELQAERNWEIWTNQEDEW